MFTVCVGKVVALDQRLCFDDLCGSVHVSGGKESISAVTVRCCRETRLKLL